MKCIVCKSYIAKSFEIVDSKKYWHCKFCYAKFLDSRYFLSHVDEEGHYLKHQNHIYDNGYRDFLSRLVNPLRSKLEGGDKGLDFGCGNGPALKHMMEENGFDVELYDPFFYPDKSVFYKEYNFITCTEVVEHFFDPYKEFNRLDLMLKKGGWLAVMTCFLTDANLFANWHYRRDPTHVVFYSEETFKVIAAQRKWTCEIADTNIVLLSKDGTIP